MTLRAFSIIQSSSVVETDLRAGARELEATRNRLFIGRALLTIIIAFVYLVSGLSEQLANGLRTAFSSIWVVNGMYVLITVFGFAALMFPLSLYEEHIVERSYGLSTQTLEEWFSDYLKSLAIELVIATFFFELLYALLRWTPQTWWLWTAISYLGMVVVFAALAPVLILPLFYRAEPVTDAPWVARARDLARRAGLPNIGIYQWALSDKTNIENATLAGLGRTRRILISDIVLEQNTEDEILAFVAHELGHYHHRDLWSLIAVESLIALAGFYATHHLLMHLVPFFGFESAADISTFPILVLCLFVLSVFVMPATNTFSRWREFRADAFAVRLLGTADPLVAALTKAAQQNLSDTNPSPFAEFLLHSHPSLARRIEHAKRLERKLAQPRPDAVS